MHTGHDTEFLEEEDSFEDGESFEDTELLEEAAPYGESEPVDDSASPGDAEPAEQLADVPDNSAEASPVDPAALPAVSSDSPELARFLKRGCHVAVPTLEADAVLHLRAGNVAAADWSDALLLRGAFGAIEVAQGTRLLRALTGIDVDGERANVQDSDRGRWTWLQAAVLGRLPGTPFQCVGVIDFETVDVPDAVTVTLSLQSGTHAIHTHLRADAASLLAFLREGQWQCVRPPLSELLGLRCDAVISVARHTVPANVLAGVAAGDILVPDSPRFDCNGEGALRIGPTQMRVRYEAPGLLTVTALEDNMQALDDNDYFLTEEDLLPAALAGEGGFGGPIDPARLAELEATPLTLDFELGKTTMSLGELRALGVGSVLPFEGGSPATITIVSAGWTLGYGEIVEIDGQLGVRITHWSTEE